MGFTAIVDMRGTTWNVIKPILKALQECFPAKINAVYIIKSENFWQKQRTNFGSNKFTFEVRMFRDLVGAVNRSLNLTECFDVECISLEREDVCYIDKMKRRVVATDNYV